MLILCEEDSLDESKLEKVVPLIMVLQLCHGACADTPSYGKLVDHIALVPSLVLDSTSEVYSAGWPVEYAVQMV